MTMIKSLENPTTNHLPNREKGNVNSAQIEKVDSRKTMEELDTFHNTYRPPANYFWQSIVVSSDNCSINYSLKYIYNGACFKCKKNKWIIE